MKFLAAAALLLLTVTSAADMEVWLYSHGSNAVFTIDSTQRCYTVKKLWNDRAVRAKWKNLPITSTMAFYEDSRCRGTSATSSDTPSGSYSFESEDKLNKRVSSFMVQGSSKDATAGFLDVKADAAAYPVIGD